MSSHGYIYCRNWRRYQHGNAGLPWHKVYAALLHDDAYCDLTLADRGTLHGLWMLASASGDGRVSSSRTYLARHLNVRRVSLEPLIQAGWIEIRLERAETNSRTDKSREEEIRIEPPKSPAQRGTGKGINGSKNGNQGETEEQAAERHRIVRELLPFPMRERWVSDKVLDTFHPADCKTLSWAWGRSNDLRDAGQKIEEASNPRAYALAIAGHHADTGAPRG